MAKDKLSMQLSEAQPQSLKGQQQECQPAATRAEIWHLRTTQGFEVDSVFPAGALSLLYTQQK